MVAAEFGGLVFFAHGFSRIFCDDKNLTGFENLLGFNDGELLRERLQWKARNEVRTCNGKRDPSCWKSVGEGHAQIN